MNLRCLLTVVVTSMALSQTAIAQQRDPFERLETIHPEVLFKGLVREEDVSLMFNYLRESMAATARGEEPRESEAVKRRSEEIQREMAVRGTVLIGALLSAFESAAKQAIREAMSDISSGTSRSRTSVLPGASY
jgi:hypothetical protein